MIDPGVANEIPKTGDKKLVISDWRAEYVLQIGTVDGNLNTLHTDVISCHHLYHLSRARVARS